jgi:hypothetical protein
MEIIRLMMMVMIMMLVMMMMMLFVSAGSNVRHSSCDGVTP